MPSRNYGSSTITFPCPAIRFDVRSHDSGSQSVEVSGCSCLVRQQLLGLRGVLLCCELLTARTCMPASATAVEPTGAEPTGASMLGAGDPIGLKEAAPSKMTQQHDLQCLA